MLYLHFKQVNYTPSPFTLTPSFVRHCIEQRRFNKSYKSYISHGLCARHTSARWKAIQPHVTNTPHVHASWLYHTRTLICLVHTSIACYDGLLWNVLTEFSWARSMRRSFINNNTKSLRFMFCTFFVLSNCHGFDKYESREKPDVYWSSSAVDVIEWTQSDADRLRFLTTFHEDTLTQCHINRSSLTDRLTQIQRSAASLA